MAQSIRERAVDAAGLTFNVATAGEGPAVVLLHGFPHTWQLWGPIIPALARDHTVIAPDLRGLGGTTRPAGGYDAQTPGGGYDAQTIADDVVALLDALSVPRASVVAIDLAVASAFLLGIGRGDRVEKLVLMESLVGPLPGAESFSPPWWFGFHAVPGFAERVLEGHEPEYFDFFLDAGTRGRGVEDGFRDAVHRSYSGRPSLRAAFEHYRAFPTNASQIVDAVASKRLTVPTMTVGAFPVADATFRQLEPIADDLVGHVLSDCGHIVPQDRPEELLALLLPFLAGEPRSARAPGLS